MERIESVDGLFHEGNPSSGQKGTKVTATWLNALQEIVIGVGGSIVTAAVETTLVESHGVLFANPAEGTTVLYHLPNYDSVGGTKRFNVKNIGQGVAMIDSADGKTIDGLASIPVEPGEKVTVAKDGSNWQTI
jgi:hypothetical protein